MKPIKFSRFFVFALVLTLAAVGCKKTPVKVTDINGPPLAGPKSGAAGTGLEEPKPVGPITQPETPGSSATSAGATTSSTGIPMANPAGFEGMIEHPEILKADSVYFDFDSAVVKAGERPKAAAAAEYLKAHPGEKVRIAGNCDERGTEEYNRALGERRALALREDLVNQGIDPSRVDTVTYGKDKPVALGHDEAAWRENRRGDFVVLTAPVAP